MNTKARSAASCGGPPAPGIPPAKLSESQAERLRLVWRHPEVSISVAAAELGLISSTAFTLVSKLTRAGLPGW